MLNNLARFGAALDFNGPPLDPKWHPDSLWEAQKVIQGYPGVRWPPQPCARVCFQPGFDSFVNSFSCQFEYDLAVYFPNPATPLSTHLSIELYFSFPLYALEDV